MKYINIYYIKATLVSAVMGFVISFSANYFLIPIPESVAANAIGNGISGFMSGFFGLAIFLIKDRKTSNNL